MKAEYEVTKSAFDGEKRHIPPPLKPGMSHLNTPEAVFVTTGSENRCKKARPYTNTRGSAGFITSANYNCPVSLHKQTKIVRFQVKGLCQAGTLAGDALTQ
jgi:hypothetical protein